MGKVEHLVQLLGRVALGKVETGRNSARTSARLRGASNNGRGQKRNGGRRLLVHVHLKINEFLHDPVKSYKEKSTSLAGAVAETSSDTLLSSPDSGSVSTVAEDLIIYEIAI